MSTEILSRATKQLDIYKKLLEDRRVKEASRDTANKQMDKVLAEQDLLQRTTVAVQQAKPLLSASSIKQCEELANQAIATIFDFDATVVYEPEAGRFLLNRGEFSTDLAEAEGGGIITVISAVFEMFLLVKMGCRRFMAYDEAWYAVSDKYYESFISFMRQACEDLGIDILLVSHDERLTREMVDHVFRIEGGKALKIK